MNGVLKPRCYFCIGSLLVFLLIPQFLPAGGSSTDATLTLIFIDLTRSTPPKEHLANLRGISALLTTLGPGHVLIYGITDATFANPQLLLDGEIPQLDTGDYFYRIKQRSRARRLQKRWQQISPQLDTRARCSDIIGALQLAALLFSEWPGPKRLYLFSDLRHAMPDLDIEKMRKIPPKLIAAVKRKGLVADFHGVEVTVFGAHTHRKNYDYHASLRRFWRDYFAAAGATLKRFSLSRDLTDTTTEQQRSE